MAVGTMVFIGLCISILVVLLTIFLYNRKDNSDNTEIEADFEEVFGEPPVDEGHEARTRQRQHVRQTLERFLELGSDQFLTEHPSIDSIQFVRPNVAMGYYVRGLRLAAHFGYDVNSVGKVTGHEAP